MRIKIEKNYVPAFVHAKFIKNYDFIENYKTLYAENVRSVTRHQLFFWNGTVDFGNKLRMVVANLVIFSRKDV